MATEPEEPTQSLQSQYEKQFADHLADNREEQARLRKRLEQLVADEAWLVKALEVVSAPADAEVQAPGEGSAQPQDSTSGPTEPADAEGSAAVPKQRRDKPARTRKATAAKKTTARKATAAKSGEPPLGELLLAVLGKHAGQPRTAGEVAGDLEREYPERSRDVNTVRNTLERLVAKGRVERRRQKHTVLYTAGDASVPGADAAAAAAEASPAAGAAGAEEAEKAPAQA